MIHFALALILMLAPFAVLTQSANASALRSTATPVVMVHGFQPGTCPGFDVTRGPWGGTYLTLSDAGWTGPLLPVSFYQCDTNGVDITGYGPETNTATLSAPQITQSVPAAGYTAETPIDQIAHDLAWFVYDTYSRQGQPVDLIGASMGGLIIRSAILRVQQQDPTFPPMLLVTDAVTIATPHNGASAAATAIACGTSLSCQQMITGSPYLTSLGTTAPQARGGTDWTLIGSAACDIVPVSSALGMWPAHLLGYTKPCYSHTAYLWDRSPAADASAYYLNPGAPIGYTTTGNHSLRAVLTALKTGGS
jgi:hypothetical protein